MENLMIGVLTHHWVKADSLDEAKKLLDGKRRRGESHREGHRRSSPREKSP